MVSVHALVEVTNCALKQTLNVTQGSLAARVVLFIIQKNQLLRKKNEHL
jgi:hypothetical protein